MRNLARFNWLLPYVALLIIFVLLEWVVPALLDALPAFVVLVLMFATLIGLAKLLDRRGEMNVGGWALVVLLAAFAVSLIYTQHLAARKSSDADSWWAITGAVGLVTAAFVAVAAVQYLRGKAAKGR